MARNHLRPHSGGHPSQGPVREMANPTPSPSVGQDFPDEPDESTDAQPEDKPNLAAFAAKLGIDRRDGDDATEGLDEQRSPAVAVREKAAAAKERVTAGAATGLAAVAQRLQRLADRLADR